MYSKRDYEKSIIKTTNKEIDIFKDEDLLELYNLLYIRLNDWHIDLEKSKFFKTTKTYNFCGDYDYIKINLVLINWKTKEQKRFLKTYNFLDLHRKESIYYDILFKINKKD